VDDDLAALNEEFWQGWLAAHPVAATSIGDRRFDDRLDDQPRRDGASPYTDGPSH
jgi:hypothetical protein